MWKVPKQTSALSWGEQKKNNESKNKNYLKTDTSSALNKTFQTIK